MHTAATLVGSRRGRCLEAEETPHAPAGSVGHFDAGLRGRAARRGAARPPEECDRSSYSVPAGEKTATTSAGPLVSLKE